MTHVLVRKHHVQIHSTLSLTACSKEREKWLQKWVRSRNMCTQGHSWLQHDCCSTQSVSYCVLSAGDYGQFCVASPSVSTCRSFHGRGPFEGLCTLHFCKAAPPIIEPKSQKCFNMSLTTSIARVCKHLSSQCFSNWETWTHLCLYFYLCGDFYRHKTSLCSVA